MNIPDGSRIYPDADTLIYYFERHARYGGAAAELLKRVETGAITAVVSTVVLTEVLVTEYERSFQSGQELKNAMLSYPNLAWFPVTADLAARAAVLRAAYTLRTPDALHVATALEQRANWFVTNDRRLRKVEREGIHLWLFNDHA